MGHLAAISAFATALSTALSAADASASNSSGHNAVAVATSKCTLYPGSGVVDGQDVSVAAVSSAQACLEACEHNSLCCMGEFDATYIKCYLKSEGEIVATGRRPGSFAFNCTGGVNSCRSLVGPHPPPSSARTASPVPVTVAVDLSAPAKAFPHYWKRSFGSGHARLSLRTDWQGHLKEAVQELGLQGVRYHGILDDDMGVVVGWRQYDFSKVKASWDFQISLGLHPVCELSFMPAWLANCSWTDPAAQDPVRARTHSARTTGPPGSSRCRSTSMAYQGVTMPPIDFEDWYHLVHALVSFATETYGAREVRQWYWECWNELWGMPFPETYMKLYNASAAAIKAVDPSYKVGGPATAQLAGVLGGVPAFVNESTTRGIPFDFVSTHFYPSSGNRTSFRPCAGGDEWDPGCFAKQMQLTRAAIPKEKGLFITEYNAGCCMKYFQHDNAGAAAFAFRSVGELAGIVDVLSWCEYWLDQTSASLSTCLFDDAAAADDD